MQNRLFLAFAFLSLFAIAVAGGEAGVTVERGDSPSQEADRTRIARGMYRHDFENVRDPETGLPLPESAALGREMWPDFWEPVRAVGFPEYLIPSVRVVQDDSGQIPGAYRDVPNHVLRMDFDGTRVGIRTRTPVPINPGLAYEYSLFVRDDGLKGARIRTGVDWLRIDPSAVEVLRSDEIPGIGTGQVDWPVTPARMLINDPPPAANAARFFVIVDRDPDSVGGAYHASVWLDNLTLRPLPKVVVGAPHMAATSPETQLIPVHYSGLFDNVPDPANPGYFKGRRYTRQVEITDVFGRPLNPDPGVRAPVIADEDGSAVEEIPSPRANYGVYYFNIRLYDADGRLATDVMRAVAVMRPGQITDDIALRSQQPVFGVRSGEIPESILASAGFLRHVLQRSGAKMTKIIPWRDSYAGPGLNTAYYNSLAEEIRNLRAAGIGVTGVIRPPSAMFDTDQVRRAAEANPDRLSDILREAGRRLGLFMDGWQWGDDGDDSLRNIPADRNVDELMAALRQFAGGMPVTAGLTMDGNERGDFPLRPDIVQGFVRGSTVPAQMWPLAAPVFPWLFEPYFNERGFTYPPPRLSRLAPPPAADLLEEQARLLGRTGTWISLETEPAYSHEPNAASERAQLEELAIQAIYAVVLKPDVVFMGELFDPARGLLRRSSVGNNMLETMARPAFLATATIAELLEGAEYLGQLWLLPPFEAHVFRRPGSDSSVIALWHNDSRDELPLARREIANGLPLSMMDWAGNVSSLPTSIPVRRVPLFITGMPASLALTRMSIRINPDIIARAANRRQNQTIEMVNHMTRQTPVLLRLKYAARMPDGGMENGWVVRPEEMRINLAPVTPQLAPGRMRYVVSPDPNSQIQTASPAYVDKSGQKIAQAIVSINTTPPADMLIYLPFRLHSDIDVDVEQLARFDDPHFVTLQLKLRWFPPESERRRGEIRLTPFYMKRGQMKESSPFPVTVKALPPALRGDQNAAFEAVELRIPKRPAIQTWVGLDEDGGSNYYLVDVTDFIHAE